MSVATARAAALDGYGETALLEAIRLSHAGELTTCARTMDERDAAAIASVFRAIGSHLDVVERWMETIRAAVTAI